MKGGSRGGGKQRARDAAKKEEPRTRWVCQDEGAEGSLQCVCMGGG
jgi:hypothetical protein